MKIPNYEQYWVYQTEMGQMGQMGLERTRSKQQIYRCILIWEVKSL